LAVNDADSYATSSSSNGNGNGIVPGSNIPFLSPRLSPSLNFNEFALLCAHLMSASACSPVERLKSCFDETLSFAHSQWAKRAVAVYTPSFSSGLSGELGGGDADIDKPSGPATTSASTAPQTQTKLASFKSTWKQVWVELDAADSAESNREQVALPTYVCASLANFLFSLSHCAACSLLSVDTVQQLPSGDLFAPLAPLPSSEEEERKVPVSRMAHYASTQLYEIAICTVADTYSALLDRAASTACLSDEDVALQVVFDLMACVALEARCGLEVSRSLSRCLSGWRARLDPINAEILTPMLTTASEQFSQKTHLLLPGLRRHREGTVAVPAASSSQAAMNSNASAISGLFPLSASSRFSLLPLPMSTHFQGSSWIDRDREKDRDRDRDRGAATEKAPEVSPYASKSLLSGLSLSQQQNHAEQLGKSLISTWGTFLGSNTADKKTRKLHE
jgi:hypothetical protein